MTPVLFGKMHVLFQTMTRRLWSHGHGHGHGLNPDQKWAYGTQEKAHCCIQFMSQAEALSVTVTVTGHEIVVLEMHLKENEQPILTLFRNVSR